MTEKIFITGGSGLVGYHVTRHLLQRGFEVTAAVRATSKTDALKQLSGSLNLVSVDINDRQALISAMQGAGAVVHCAGSVEMGASREDIFNINVNGTRNALLAATKAGVRHFVHISSLSVITGKTDQFDVDESAPLRRSGEAYGDSKVEAERVVAAEGQALKTTVLRPGFIYGPGERAWMPRLIANISAGKAMLIDNGFRQTNVIYVENLARAVELSLFNEKAYGRTYNLTDGETPTKKELFDAICAGLNLKPVTKSIPRPLARTVFGAVAAVQPFLSKQSKANLSRFSSGAFRLAAVNQGFSIKRAEHELGYTHRVPFAQGMRETLKHFTAADTKSASPPPAMAVH